MGKKHWNPKGSIPDWVTRAYVNILQLATLRTPITVRKLCGRMGWSNNAMMIALERLKEEGLVEWAPSGIGCAGTIRPTHCLIFFREKWPTLKSQGPDVPPRPSSA